MPSAGRRPDCATPSFGTARNTWGGNGAAWRIRGYCAEGRIHWNLPTWHDTLWREQTYCSPYMCHPAPASPSTCSCSHRRLPWYGLTPWEMRDRWGTLVIYPMLPPHDMHAVRQESVVGVGGLIVVVEVLEATHGMPYCMRYLPPPGNSHDSSWSSATADPLVSHSPNACLAVLHRTGAHST